MLEHNAIKCAVFDCDTIVSVACIQCEQMMCSNCVSADALVSSEHQAIANTYLKIQRSSTPLCPFCRCEGAHAPITITVANPACGAHSGGHLAVENRRITLTPTMLECPHCLWQTAAYGESQQAHMDLATHVHTCPRRELTWCSAVRGPITGVRHQQVSPAEYLAAVARESNGGPKPSLTTATEYVIPNEKGDPVYAVMHCRENHSGCALVRALATKARVDARAVQMYKSALVGAHADLADANRATDVVAAAAMRYVEQVKVWVKLCVEFAAHGIADRAPKLPVLSHEGAIQMCDDAAVVSCGSVTAWVMNIPTRDLIHEHLGRAERRPTYPFTILDLLGIAGQLEGTGATVDTIFGYLELDWFIQDKSTIEILNVLTAARDHPVEFAGRLILDGDQEMPRQCPMDELKAALQVMIDTGTRESVRAVKAVRGYPPIRFARYYYEDFVHLKTMMPATIMECLIGSVTNTGSLLWEDKAFRVTVNAFSVELGPMSPMYTVNADFDAAFNATSTADERDAVLQVESLKYLHACLQDRARHPLGIAPKIHLVYDGLVDSLYWTYFHTTNLCNIDVIESFAGPLFDVAWPRGWMTTFDPIVVTAGYVNAYLTMNGLDNSSAAFEIYAAPRLNASYSVDLIDIAECGKNRAFIESILN